ncbi:MAG: hypothetical protein HYV28_21105 [Ignavibacteriales bacterium]|nr:hypothetical protein [Ignavibacteriales bacterium]
MSAYKAFSTNVEVNGETVISVVEGMGAFKATALRILEDNGISNPGPGKWYPQQAWLDSFEQIAKKVGQATLEQIGMKIPENAIFPPDINNLDKALAAIDVAYHMNHRGGEIGNYKFEKTGNNEIKLICKNPYPCNFDKGIVHSMVNKFKNPGGTVNIIHSDSDDCRNNGDNSCTFFIKYT